MDAVDKRKAEIQFLWLNPAYSGENAPSGPGVPGILTCFISLY